MKKIFIYLVFLTFFNFSFAQYPNWQQYSAGDYISCQAFEDYETLWIGANNVLIKFNINTGEVTTFNTTNSPITSNVIRSIAIDNDGNKWIGTWKHGLLKFDDNNWTVYDTANSGLPAMGIVDINIDSDDKIWMIVFCFDLSTLGGVVSYDGIEWVLYNNQNSGLPGTSYSAVVIDYYDTVWIGSRYEGLVKFDGVNWTIYNVENSDIPDDHVKSLFIDSDNTKWIGTSNGFARYDGNWTVYDTANSELPYPVVRCINKDEDNTLWIGNYLYNQGQCLTTLKNDTIWNFYTTDNSGLPGDFINSINICQNNKWIGTDNGVACYDNNDWVLFELGCGLPDDNITALAVDENNTKWIGSSGGLTKFDGDEWVTYNSNNSQLLVNSINSIEVDSSNVVYVNTNGGGIVMIDGDTWTTYNTTNSGLPNDTVHCCTFDENGELYIGTDSGFAIYDYNEWVVYDTGNTGLPYKQVRSIVFDQDGVVWFISAGIMTRLVSFNGSEWVIHVAPNGLPTWYCIYSMTVDLNNVKWFGSLQSGVYSYDGVDWSFHPNLSSFMINDIQVDKNNTKWFCSYYGLAKYNNENDYYLYTPENSGLSGKTVNTIAIDKNETKWIGTLGYGISALMDSGYTAISGNSINETVGSVNNFPNPFVSETTIQINLQRESEVSIKIFNLSGKLIKTIYKGRMKYGFNKLNWNGEDSDGSIVSPGVYIISLSIDNRKISAKRIIKL